VASSHGRSPPPEAAALASPELAQAPPAAPAAPEPLASPVLLQTAADLFRAVDTAGLVFRGVPLAAGRVVPAQPPPPPPRAAEAPPPRLSPAAQAFRSWGGAEGALGPPGRSPAAAAPGAVGGAAPPAERASPHAGAQAWPGPPPPAAELPAELSPLPDLAPPPPPPLLPLASPAAGAAPGSAFRAFAHAGPLFRAPLPPAPVQLAPSAHGWPPGRWPWQPALPGGAASSGTPGVGCAPANCGAGQGSGSGPSAAASADWGAALLRDALRAHAAAGEHGAALLLPQSVPVAGGDGAESDASAARVRAWRRRALAVPPSDSACLSRIESGAQACV